MEKIGPEPSPQDSIEAGWNELVIAPAFVFDNEQIMALQTMAQDEEIKEAIRSGNEELTQLIDFWRDYSSEHFKDEPLIPLKEYLQNHPELIDQVRLSKRKVFTLEWDEHVQPNGVEEQNFLDIARQIGNGDFTEIIQFTIATHNGELIKKSTVSGGLEVSKESIDKLNFLADIPATIDRMYIVHNHPDVYSHLSLPPDDKPREGFITVGGLSDTDIKFADKVWREDLGQTVPVTMVVVNERGYSFAYEAGTSRARDWENDDTSGAN